MVVLLPAPLGPRSPKSVDGAFRNAKVQMVHGGGAPVDLCKLAGFNDILCHFDILLVFAAVFYRIQDNEASLCLPFCNLKFTLNDSKNDSLSW